MEKLFLLLIFLSNIILAKDYALIVGNWDYSRVEGFKSLKKSVIEKDIDNYQTILKSKKVSDIHILKNATKSEIMGALKYIEKKIKKNDRFYMFFTGHGLSPDNENYIKYLYTTKYKNKKLKYYMKNSGAIVPVDLNKSNLLGTLIIGSIDLRPIFKKIDSKVKSSLIVFDACYSEKSSRNYRGRINKNLNKNILRNNKGEYPYNKIVYISSSIIEAEVGIFSNLLKNCLIKNNKNNIIEKCLNNSNRLEAQIPAIFPKDRVITIF